MCKLDDVKEHQNPNAGRRTRRYVAMRTKFAEECEMLHAVCHLCGQPIDYRAPRDVPGDGFQIDHFYPLKDRPDLAEDYGNFRPSHGKCNLERGDGPIQPSLGVPSRRW